MAVTIIKAKAVESFPAKLGNESKERMALSAKLRSQKWLRSMLVLVTGGLAPAVLLEQIIYWHAPDKTGKSKLRVKYMEDYWLAKPRDEMLLETGISLKQYNSAISKLKDLKIIDYRVGGYAGKPTPFIRFDAAKVVELLAPFVPKGNKPLSPFDTNLCALLEQSNTVSLTISLTTKEHAASQPEPSEFPELDEPTGAKEMLPKNGLKKGPTNAQETLEKLATTTKSKHNSKIMELYILWAVTVPKYHEEVKFVGKFTRKQEAQLLMLNKAWPDTGKVLEHVLIRWVKFGKLVVSQTEAKTYPSVPSIDFLVKHKDIAMNFYLAATKVPEEKVLMKPGAINCTEEPKMVKVVEPVKKVPETVVAVGGVGKEVEDKAALKQQLLKELLKG